MSFQIPSELYRVDINGVSTYLPCAEPDTITSSGKSLSVRQTLRQLSPYAQLPVFGTTDSACFDIRACLPEGAEVKGYSAKNEPQTRTIVSNQLIRLEPYARVLIPTGWAINLAPQVSLRIYSRSGMALKQGLVVVNGVGVVDADYRHEVFVLMSNISGCTSVIEHGDRIAQGELVPQMPWHLRPQMPLVEFSWVTVEDADWFTTQRTGGFGSTGK